MPKAKYSDPKTGHPLNADLDGCPLDDWSHLYGKAPFARHPAGFNIFLPPASIASSNEYAEADPYAVEHNISSGFHTRRIEITIELLLEAVSSVQGTLQVLDLGCGQGHITEKMRRALNCAEFTALDFSVSAVEYAHQHFPQIDFAVADACETPYANEYFDVVVCNNLWEHVPDPLRLLREIRRVLKPSGHLIVSTPSRYRTANLLRVLRGRPVAFMSHHHVTEYTVGQVNEQLAYGGFHVRKIVTRPIPAASWKTRLAQSAFSTFISLVASHHQLEATVFYLAHKPTEDAK